MQTPFIYEKKVDFHETDMAGIVHFSNYFKWMEMAEHALFRQLDIALITENETTVYGWPRTRAKAEFHHPLRFEDTLQIAVHIKDVLPKAIRYTFRFYKINSDPKVLVASGEMSAIFAAFQKNEKNLVSASMQAAIVEKLTNAQPLSQPYIPSPQQ